MKQRYKVSVWVPSKGWVLVKSTTSMEGAYTMARALEPLEVQVVYGDHHYWGGTLCMPVMECLSKHNSLDKMLATDPDSKLEPYVSHNFVAESELINA